MTCAEIQQQFQMLSNNLLAVNMSIQAMQGNIAVLSVQLSGADVPAAIPAQPYTQQAAQTRAALCMTLSNQWMQLSQLFTMLGGYEATQAQLQGQLDSLIQQWNDEGCQGSISGG